MIAWWWLIPAFMGGAYVGMVLISLLHAARGRDNDNND